MNKYLILFAIIILYFLLDTNEGMKAKLFLNTDMSDADKNIESFFNKLENISNEELFQV